MRDAGPVLESRERRVGACRSPIALTTFLDPYSETQNRTLERVLQYLAAKHDT